MLKLRPLQSSHNFWSENGQNAPNFLLPNMLPNFSTPKVIPPHGTLNLAIAHQYSLIEQSLTVVMALLE